MLVADRLPQSYPQIYLFLSLRMADYLYTFHCSPTLWVTFLSYTFILILWEQEHWFTVSLVASFRRVEAADWIDGYMPSFLSFVTRFVSLVQYTCTLESYHCQPPATGWL